MSKLAGSLVNFWAHNNIVFKKNIFTGSPTEVPVCSGSNHAESGKDVTFGGSHIDDHI